MGTIERKESGNLDKSSTTAVDQPNLGKAPSKKEKGESEKGRTRFTELTSHFFLFTFHSDAKRACINRSTAGKCRSGKFRKRFRQSAMASSTDL